MSSLPRWTKSSFTPPLFHQANHLLRHSLPAFVLAVDDAPARLFLLPPALHHRLVDRPDGIQVPGVADLRHRLLVPLREGHAHDLVVVDAQVLVDRLPPVEEARPLLGGHEVGRLLVAAPAQPLLVGADVVDEILVGLLAGAARAQEDQRHDPHESLRNPPRTAATSARPSSPVATSTTKNAAAQAGASPSVTILPASGSKRPTAAAAIVASPTRTTVNAGTNAPKRRHSTQPETTAPTAIAP